MVPWLLPTVSELWAGIALSVPFAVLSEAEVVLGAFTGLSSWLPLSLWCFTSVLFSRHETNPIAIIAANSIFTEIFMIEFLIFIKIRSCYTNAEFFNVVLCPIRIGTRL